MSDGVVTRLGRDVVNVEGAREVADRVDSCLRRSDGRGRRQESRRVTDVRGRYGCPTGL